MEEVTTTFFTLDSLLHAASKSRRPASNTSVANTVSAPLTSFSPIALTNCKFSALGRDFKAASASLNKESQTRGGCIRQP